MADRADEAPRIDGKDWKLEVSGLVDNKKAWTLDELTKLPEVSQITRHICVEGWSAGARWIGIDLMELVERAGGSTGSRVVLSSLEPDGPYRRSVISGPQLHAALLATHLNGERLSLDHGYPLRLIAPNRAGVLNTKWLARVEVRA